MRKFTSRPNVAEGREVGKEAALLTDTGGGGRLSVAMPQKEEKWETTNCIFKIKELINFLFL